MRPAGFATAVACTAVAAGAFWAWNTLAQREARIAGLEAALRAAGMQQTRELAQCRAATLAAAPQVPATPAVPTAQPVSHDARMADTPAASGTQASAPMDLGAALKAFQASQPPPGSAGLSPFATQR